MQRCSIYYLCDPHRGRRLKKWVILPPHVDVSDIFVRVYYLSTADAVSCPYRGGLFAPGYQDLTADAVSCPYRGTRSAQVVSRYTYAVSSRFAPIGRDSGVRRGTDRGDRPGLYLVLFSACTPLPPRSVPNFSSCGVSGEPTMSTQKLILRSRNFT